VDRRKKTTQSKSAFVIWRKRFSKTVKADPVSFAIWITAAVLLFGAIAFYLTGFVKQNISGEAFYDFQYPYLFPFSESWKIFFLDRIQSRLMHGVFVSALFHVFGFNPPVYYLIGLILVICTATLITLVLRSFIKLPWISVLLVATFTWLPLNIPDLMVLKKLHHALAWFAFWLAVFLWQKWFEKKRIFSLLAAALAFLASILSYEVAIALFPVAVFITLPKLKDVRDFIGYLGMSIWITFLSGLAFLNLEGVKRFSRVESLSAIGGWDLGYLVNSSLSLLSKLPAAIWNSGLRENPSGIQDAVGKTILVITVIGLFGVIRQFFRKKNRIQEKFSLVLTGLWLGVAAYLPFILAGQAPDSDSLRGAAFGTVFIVLAATSWIVEQGKKVLGNLFLTGICLFWICTGFIYYAQGVMSSKQEDLILQNVVVTLKKQVPDVAEGTNFIFVNSGVGRTGCIGFVNMLYDRSKLHCIHLLSGDTQESYTRTDAGLVETGGRLWPERFIIVTFDDQGRVTVLDQLDQDDFEILPVTWESIKPLVTNRSLIYPDVTSSGRNFDFYNYMMEQYLSR